MKRGMMAALAAIMVLPAVEAIGQEERSFECGFERNYDVDEIKKRVDGLMAFVLGEYRDRWDAQHIREQCKAFANGESYDISCLKGERDWEEIEAMVPDRFYELDRSEFAEPLEKLSAENPYSEAIDYCESVGAIE